MSGKSSLKLLQLPVPPPSYFAATGNVPLAAGTLAVSLETAGIVPELCNVSVVNPEVTDVMGDQALLDHILKEEPEFVGISLYLWNSERSLWICDQIKKRSPETKVFLGGPEVNADNPFVLENQSFDVAVTGEAEETFQKLMMAYLGKNDWENIPNALIRSKASHPRQFSSPENPDFPLTQFSSPYEKGFLSVDPKRATYLETVRGCKSQCTYCFYPKSSTNLRTLDIPETVQLIKSLKDKGAKELVFLDPTFNHRPGFEKFLDAIAEVNADGQLKMFAELRAEGVTPNLAKKLAKAGFNKIELGLQSVNEETLQRIKRYGKPEKVAEVAKMLAGEGVELLLDLIIGLPGDTPDDVERGIHFFLEHGLEEWVQAFPLSLLPGTNMRRDAEKEGILFSPFPPYRIIETSTFPNSAIRDSVFLAEDLLGRRLDETPRPFLCQADAAEKDRLDFYLDRQSDTEIINQLQFPMNRHSALWFSANDWQNHWQRIPKFLLEKLKTDPFGIVDIVLKSKDIIPVPILEDLQLSLASMPPNYLTRTLQHRDENMQFRLVLLLTTDTKIDHIHFEKAQRILHGLVYQEMKLESILKNLDYLGDTKPCALYLEESIPTKIWKQLVDKADPESIVFSSRKWEKLWTEEVLGYGES